MNGTSFEKSLWVADSISNKVIKIREFTSKISSNKFLGNEVGQKGSAIYARQISFLLIEENEFVRNVPSYAFRKDIYRPYEIAFLEQDDFSSTLFPTIVKDAQENLNYNELTYLVKQVGEDTTSTSGNFIHLPQLQGLIYVEACKSCLVTYEPTVDTACLFCMRLLQEVHIRNNTFEDNFEGFTLFTNHDLPRASLIMLVGAVNAKISETDFTN